MDRVERIRGPGVAPIAGFYLFRLRAKETTEWTRKLLGMQLDRTGDSRPQTVVFIALEDLGPHNGFPMELRKGEDVCMDGNDALLFPPTDGGEGILICLNL